MRPSEADLPSVALAKEGERRRLLRDPVVAASRRDVCSVYRRMRREGRPDLARLLYARQGAALRGWSERLYRTLQSDMRCGMELILAEGLSSDPSSVALAEEDGS